MHISDRIELAKNQYNEAIKNKPYGTSFKLCLARKYAIKNKVKHEFFIKLMRIEHKN